MTTTPFVDRIPSLQNDRLLFAEVSIHLFSWLSTKLPSGIVQAPTQLGNPCFCGEASDRVHSHRTGHFAFVSC